MSLLTSAWLRRVALPLRTGNPQLYRTLNGLRGKLMTRGRDLDAYQSAAFDRFEARVGIAGKRILELGSDPDLRLLRAFVEKGAKLAIGVNNDAKLPPARRPRALPDNLKLVFGDASALAFAANSVDAVFSVATFEHILELEAALREMHRVLAPGGVVYTNFGPIWSSGKGHHLRVKVGELELRHYRPDKNPLPDHSHLLLEPAELREALRTLVDPSLLEPAVEWVYRDPGINRVMHHEYLELFARSPFRVESIVPERDPIAPALRRILQFKYPRERDFDVVNMEVILVKES